MKTKDLFKQMEDFQEELDKTNFSQRQKDILYQEKARSLLTSVSEAKTNILEKNKIVQVREMPDSFSSIINRAGVNQHMDFVLLAVYHKIINLGEENANTKDINEEYQLARMKSSNTNVFLNNLVRKGLLMSNGKKDGLTAFTITRDGVRYVEEKLKNGNK